MESTPPHELHTTELTGSTVSTVTTGNTVQTALNDDEEYVNFVGGGGGGFDDDMGEEGIGGISSLGKRLITTWTSDTA